MCIASEILIKHINVFFQNRIDEMLSFLPTVHIPIYIKSQPTACMTMLKNALHNKLIQFNHRNQSIVFEDLMELERQTCISRSITSTRIKIPSPDARKQSANASIRPLSSEPYAPVQPLPSHTERRKELTRISTRNFWSPSITKLLPQFRNDRNHDRSKSTNHQRIKNGGFLD